MARRAAALQSSPKPASAQPRVETRSGASAAVDRDTIVVRDPSGEIVVTYDAATGSATIVAPRGDLNLQSRKGSVRIAAAKELELTSGTRTFVQSELLELAAATSRLKTGFADLAAEAVRVASPGIVVGVGRLQLDAQRVMQRAIEVYQQVEGVIETRAGRVRTLVKGATQVFSKSTSVVSEQDTFVDGRRVLLG